MDLPFTRREARPLQQCAAHGAGFSLPTIASLGCGGHFGAVMPRLLLAVLLLLASGCVSGGHRPAPDPRLAIQQASAALGLPGMTVGIWRDGEERVFAVGVRQRGAAAAVEPGDSFHLGSVTKPFTATLAARLVEQGRMSWSDTVDQRLGRGPAMRSQYLGVTLADLLAHRGGLRENPPLGTTGGPDNSDLVAQRRWASDLILSLPPAATPRRSFHYSNFHYVVAAAMMEQATGQSWEDLLWAELVRPLALEGVGLDAPSGPDDPRGHDESGRPVPPGPEADNPPFARPAGGIHMPVRTMLAFGVDHLRGARGVSGRLLQPASYQLLHAPIPGAEATGWSAGANGAVHHEGSNGYWFALLRVLPRERLVIAIAANSVGRDPAETSRGLWALSESLK
jgi:D-alanyl-D-alanine carboxypeptidase